MSQVEAFSNVIILATYDSFIIIWINKVLIMGWVESTKFFCDFMKILMDMSNTIANTLLPMPWYVTIINIPKTGPGLPHILASLTHMD